MSAFLLDANLSPRTRDFLQRLGPDVAAPSGAQLGFGDEQIASLAKAQGRVIITFDLDFGEIYHLRERGQLGVIILRIEDQTVESVNAVLHRFFESDLSGIELERSLVVVEEDRVRIVRGE